MDQRGRVCVLLGTVKHHWGIYLGRPAAPLSIFCLVLLSGSVFSGMFGGWGGFRWMLVHGASGPFVFTILDGKSPHIGDMLLAAVALSVGSHEEGTPVSQK